MDKPKQGFKESNYFITWLGEDGFVRTIAKENAEIELSDALENTEMVNSFIGEEKRALIVDIKGIKSVSKEARNHFSMRNRSTKVYALAMISKNMISKTIGSFFLGLNKPAVPTKLFTSEKEAIEWLKKQ